MNRIITVIFRPPYNGLPWLIAGYVLLSCLIYTYNGPFTGHVVGFDDQVRMVQVLELVNGKGWYDHLITRANPPDGFASIWTRIVDLPLAAVVIAAQQVVDQQTAALVAVTVVPLGGLLILFATARYFARPLVGKANANLITLFLMFTPILNKKPMTLSGFFPGEAGHHSWYIILNVLMFGAVARLALGVKGRAPALLLALAIGLLVAVGIEGFPMIGGVCAVLAAIGWAFDDAQLSRRSAIAVSYGALLTLLLLPLHQPPAHWADISFSQPSILGSILIGTAAVFLWLEYLTLRDLSGKRAVSLVVLVILAALFGGLSITAFPQILDGPAAALSPQEREMAFANHPEAWTMWKLSSDWVDYFGLVMPTILAIGTGIYAVVTTGNRRKRRMMAAYLGCAVIGGVMAQLLWRYVYHAMTSTCVWLLWLWRRLAKRLPDNQHRDLIVVALFFFIGPFWMMILPALNNNVPFMSQVIFYPAAIYSQPQNCDQLTIADYLNSHYQPRINLIVPDGDSSAFLYYTNLTIDFLANYPSQNKFIDNFTFFRTTDPAVARKIAVGHHIDLIAICRYLPLPQEFLQNRAGRELTFMERLVAGPLPAWLQPLPVPDTNYLLYAVDRNKLRNAGEQP